LPSPYSDVDLACGTSAKICPIVLSLATGLKRAEVHRSTLGLPLPVRVLLVLTHLRAAGALSGQGGDGVDLSEG
jgi:hypothetical protein